MNCAVCGMPAGGGAALRLAAHPGAQLSECAACGSWTYFPRRPAADQVAAHDDAAYFSHPYFTLRREVTPALRRRCRMMRQYLELPAIDGRRMLDIGCDTGALLAAAREEWGIVPAGIDVASRAVAAARAAGIEAWQTRIEEAPESLSGFALITAIDLIEHVPAPGEFLREIRRRVEPGGPAYLETPNIESFVYKFGRRLSRITGGRPAALFERLFPPEHIQYFTRRSLAAAARDAGFEIGRIGTRALPWSDIAASRFTRLAMAPLQLLDRITGRGILIRAVLLRPPDFPPPGVPGVFVLLPVLNEMENIARLLDRIEAELRDVPFTIGIVDDGSTDGTVAYLQDRVRVSGSRLHLICRKKRLRASQRGAALRTLMLWGLEHTAHGIFVEIDGDLSHRPEEMRRGIRLVAEGACDIAIASKYVEGSEVTRRPWGRRMVSGVCSALVRCLISPRIRDYSNGFRFYSRQAAQTAAARPYRYGSPIYLSEILALWLRAGLRIREFPTLYVGRNEGVSKLRLADLAKASIAVFEIAARYHILRFRR